MSTTTVATTTAAIRAPVSLAIKATATTTTIKQKLVYVIAKLRSLPPADGYREAESGERRGAPKN